jgi:hypothetical protein
VKSIVRAAVVAMFAAGAAFLSSPASADTVIGIEYEHRNYGGASLNVTVAPNGFTCTTTTSDVDASLSSMPSGWNDRVSSYRTYANCWAKHYQHSNFGGSSVGYAGSRTYIGDALNDRTSSIRWS